MPSRRPWGGASPTSGSSRTARSTPRPSGWPAWGCWPRSGSRPGAGAAATGITAGGRAVLAAWLAEPTDEALQVRSLGLLKLFFSQNAEPEDVAELARVPAELLRGGGAVLA